MLEREMLYEALHKEIPILTTQIRKLYALQRYYFLT